MALNKQRIFKYSLTVVVVIAAVLINDYQEQSTVAKLDQLNSKAAVILKKLEVKPKQYSESYERDYFGGDWLELNGCEMRQLILKRDLTEEKFLHDNCRVASGRLLDPYSGQTIMFQRGSGTSSDVQIDHVVALFNAWQTGAANWSSAKRLRFANDPIELLAVKGADNQDKGGQSAANWLPDNKAFHCHYVSRQITIKSKYDLWVTKAERQAMVKVLANCSKS